MRFRKFLMTGWMSIIIMLCMLSGCSEEKASGEWTESGLAVEKDGQIVYCVVDSFDKGFYDIDELTGMAVEEVALFNGKNRTGDTAPATVEEVARIGEANDKVRVLYRFDSASSYEKFQGESFYYGNLQDAIQSRLIFSGAVLNSGEELVTLDEANAAKYGVNHVIVTDAKNLIRLPFGVLFYSEGVEILPDGSADTRGCTDTAIIVLKK